MTPGAPTPSGRQLPAWAPYALLTALLLVMVRTSSAPVSNPDTFFHLRYGHEFLSGWSLTHPGHVSSFGHRDWVPTQWASQILMALAENAFGLAGVAWLTGVAVLATVATIFVVARAYADPLPAAVVTMLTVLPMVGNLSGRPQVVSFLFILICTHVWLRTARDLRPRWWLVPMTWVWATLHGMWPIGALIGLVALLGIVADNRSRLAERRGVLLRLAAVPVLSLAAAALTPVGPRLYSAVLLVGGRAKFHDEWGPTNFHSPPAAAVAALIVGTLLIWLFNSDLGRPDLTSVLLLLLAGAFSAYTVRTVTVAAVMTVPLLAAAVQSLVAQQGSGPRREPALVAAIGIGAVLVLTVSVPFTAEQAAPVPRWVNPALDRLIDGTPVQTSDAIGGYLMWRHPELDTVIDGYSDAYTTRHLQDQLDLMKLERGWDTKLRGSGIVYALLPTQDRLAYALVKLEHWRTLHTSRDVVMLQAPPGWGR